MTGNKYVTYIANMMTNLVISISTLEYVVEFHVVRQHVECSVTFLPDLCIFILVLFSRCCVCNVHRQTY